MRPGASSGLIDFTHIRAPGAGGIYADVSDLRTNFWRRLPLLSAPSEPAPRKRRLFPGGEAAR